MVSAQGGMVCVRLPRREPLTPSELMTLPAVGWCLNNS